MENSFKELLEQILKFRDARNWAQFHTPKEMAISLMLEASELLEHFQWKNGEELAQHLDLHRKEIGQELCDVLYWILLMAHELKIELPSAFSEKMRINEDKYPVSKSKNSSLKYDRV